jgi:hypothetical protein
LEELRHKAVGDRRLQGVCFLVLYIRFWRIWVTNAIAVLRALMSLIVGAHEVSP